MPDNRPTFDELFDPRFLESLSTLRITARRVPRGGRFADQRSRDLGHGIEFRDFRPYAAGDDLRSIDWNIYQRLGRFVLRLYEEWQDLPLYLLPDVSHSMVLEDPPRLRAGLRTAVALAAISLGQHDRVGVFPFADGLRDPIPPVSGTRRTIQIARRLAEIEPGGVTRTRAALETFARQPLRSGLAVVISDFFDPEGIEDVLAGLRRLRHRILLVPLHRATDRDPDIQGDVRLLDCETGTGADISVTSAVLERYRAAYDAHREKLVSFTASQGVAMMPIDADAPITPQLAAVFEGGSLRV